MTDFYKKYKKYKNKYIELKNNNIYGGGRGKIEQSESKDNSENNPENNPEYKKHIMDKIIEQIGTKSKEIIKQTNDADKVVKNFIHEEKNIFVILFIIFHLFRNSIGLQRIRIILLFCMKLKIFTFEDMIKAHNSAYKVNYGSFNITVGSFIKNLLIDINNKKGFVLIFMNYNIKELTRNEYDELLKLLNTNTLPETKTETETETKTETEMETETKTESQILKNNMVKNILDLCNDSLKSDIFNVQIFNILISYLYSETILDIIGLMNINMLVKFIYDFHSSSNISPQNINISERIYVTIQDDIIIINKNSVLYNTAIDTNRNVIIDYVDLNGLINFIINYIKNNNFCTNENNLKNILQEIQLSTSTSKREYVMEKRFMQCCRHKTTINIIKFDNIQNYQIMYIHDHIDYDFGSMKYIYIFTNENNSFNVKQETQYY